MFVHYSSIISDKDHKTLVPGEYVEFELVNTVQGLKAKNVKSISMV